MNIRLFALTALAASSCFGQVNGYFVAGGDLVGLDAAAFQVRYAANLSIGDSVINFTNAGNSSTDTGLATGGAQNGDICANIYAYSPDEQLVSCCSCNVTPNALNSISVKNDLASNTLTPIIPSALVIKVLSTPGGAACTASTAANPPQASPGTYRVNGGLLAWGTTIHALPVTAGSPAVTYGLTETPFSFPTLVIGGNLYRGLPSPAEFLRMTQLCAFIRANGSGYGICKSCKVGGLGASTK
jgi:hypothetical protein